MTATLILPALMAIVGALAYAISTNGKVSELGRITFAAGMFAIAFQLAHTVFRIG